LSRTRDRIKAALATASDAATRRRGAGTRGWTCISVQRAAVDGLRTGGVWLSADGADGAEVWKPLDGCAAATSAAANVEVTHDPTLEALCLEDLADLAGFPRHGRVRVRAPERRGPPL